MNARFSSLLMAAGLAGMLLAGCKRNETVPESRIFIRATVEQMAGTRVGFSDAETDNFEWTADDRIVLAATSDIVYGKLEFGAGTGTGTFSADVQQANRTDYALYPASALVSVFASPGVSLRLPAAYTIDNDDALFADESGWKNHYAKFSPMPMIAENAPDAALAFKHVCGLYRLEMERVPAGTKTIEVETDQVMCGTFPVQDPASAAPSITCATCSAGGGSVVTFTLANALEADTDGVVLNLPLPLGTYKELKVTAKSGDGTDLSQSVVDNERIIGRGSGRKLELDLGDADARMSVLETSNVQKLYLGAGALGYNVKTLDGTPVTADYILNVVSSDPSVVSVVDYDLDNGVVYVSANAVGTATLTFIAISEGNKITKPMDLEVVDCPVGAAPGIYTVNASRKVYISQGNLQYNASNGWWRFADEQYDFVGDGSVCSGTVYDVNGEALSTNVKRGSTYSANASYVGWIDLFAWGTSGENASYPPYYWGSSTACPGNGSSNLYNTNYEWGFRNEINLPDGNGIGASTGAAGVTGSWRTMSGGTGKEWEYLMTGRTRDCSYTFAYLTVKGSTDTVPGMIVFADDYVQPNTLGKVYSFASNPSSMDVVTESEEAMAAATVSYSDWKQIETAGAVFLPCGGFRNSEGAVTTPGTTGVYWSSVYVDSKNAYRLRFSSSPISPGTSGIYRYYGSSVRLVKTKL